MSVPMRQLYCIDEKPFAFPFFCPSFNFRLSNWTNLLLYASIHSFLHFDVWSISTKIHDKPQGESGIICYLHCISKVRNSVLVLPDIKAGSFSWSSTKLPRFSVLIKKSRGFFFFQSYLFLRVKAIQKMYSWQHTIYATLGQRRRLLWQFQQ